MSVGQLEVLHPGARKSESQPLKQPLTFAQTDGLTLAVAVLAACLIFLFPVAVNAQAPSYISESTIFASSTGGTYQFTDDLFIFIPSGPPQIVSYSGVLEMSGSYRYTKTNTYGALMYFYGMPDTTLWQFEFYSAQSASYRVSLWGSNPAEYQTGSMSVMSGSAPNFIALKQLAFTAQDGTSPFPSVGYSTLNTDKANSFTIQGSGEISGPSSGTYSYTVLNKATAKVQLYSAAGNGTIYLGFGTTNSGLYARSLPSGVGYQAGSFTVVDELTGSLQVIITPPAAVSAGAEWQVDNGGWQSSGSTASDLLLGTHTVTFTNIAGWNTPMPQAVTVSFGTKEISAAYSPAPSTITLQCSPATAGRISGSGTFMSGTQRTVSATPTPGFVFSNWTENGNVVSTSARFTFPLNGSRDLVANFVPNPFPPVAGTYIGLFADQSNGITPQNAGSVTLSVTRTGAASGKIQLGGNRLTFTGLFDSGGRLAVPAVGLGTAMLDVQLDLSGGSDQLAGTVTIGWSTAQLLANRLTFNSKTAPAPQIGNYTAIMPGGSNALTQPPGFACGTLTVAPSGAIRFTDSLPNGTKIAQVSSISKNRSWPLFVGLDKGASLLWGWVNITNQGAVSGDVTWIKSPDVDPSYPTGFQMQSQITGYYYAPPGRTNSVLDANSVAIVLLGGGLTSDITNYVSIGSGSRVTSTNGTALTFTPSSGAFKGSVGDPNNPQAKPISFTGVVSQDDGYGAGWFKGPTQYGTLYLLRSQ